ncbi:MAG: hypothetical protein GF393_00925 [Armatimonadia bacterium]|nr:hypothetical protein [Armatimonadia bacterium]
MSELDTVDFPAAKYVDTPALPMPVKLGDSTRDLPRAELISLAGQALRFMDEIAEMFETHEEHPSA